MRSPFAIFMSVAAPGAAAFFLAVSLCNYISEADMWMAGRPLTASDFGATCALMAVLIALLVAGAICAVED